MISQWLRSSPVGWFLRVILSISIHIYPYLSILYILGILTIRWNSLSGPGGWNGGGTTAAARLPRTFCIWVCLKRRSDITHIQWFLAWFSEVTWPFDTVSPCIPHFQIQHFHFTSGKHDMDLLGKQIWMEPKPWTRRRWKIEDPAGDSCATPYFWCESWNMHNYPYMKSISNPYQTPGTTWFCPYSVDRIPWNIMIHAHWTIFNPSFLPWILAKRVSAKIQQRFKDAAPGLDSEVVPGRCRVQPQGCQRGRCMVWVPKMMFQMV